MNSMLIAAAAVSLMAFGSGAAVASTPSWEANLPGPSASMPALGSTVLTPNGLGTVSNTMGSSAIVTLPGGTGIISSNGGGMDTLSMPGGAPGTVVPIPGAG